MSATLHSFIDIFGAEFDSVKLEKIIIPMIQRDYAQGREDPETSRIRERFLKALYSAITSKPVTLDFIYGDINESGIMTPLDGQQRLTTLFLLHWYAAKKENIDSQKYDFLKNFSYETRYSARDFCAELVKFSPDFDNKISLSEQIINQAWFPLDWEKDPTISSMLVMLDAIHKEFCNVPEIWNKLENGAITFYFLPVKDIGLTDELYIKMNSRGKPLTQFEHFKAEFERKLQELDEDLSRRIIMKIDGPWTELLWKLNEINCNWEELISGTHDDNIADDKFLNYFRFICDVICYENDYQLPGERCSEFDLLEKFFSGSNARENINTLEKFFDCWCDIKGFETPASFFESFMSSRKHEPGKIKVNYDVNILKECVKSYADFPLSKTVLLYAVIIYLMNQDEIKRKDFVRRIRIINNLIRNSEYELTNRANANRVPEIFKQTKEIISTGEIILISTANKRSRNSFNDNQLQEEVLKIDYLNEYLKNAEILFELEDHDLLYGQISIIGLENLALGKKFAELFSSCSLDKIDCALMSLGDYGQQERVSKNERRYQYGSSSSKISSAWENLFHKSANSGFENTKKILIALLSKLESFTDDALQDIIDKYITECEAKKTFTWRYYYVKYPVFRPGRYGKVSRHYSDAEGFYTSSLLYTKSNPSNNAYIPWLKAADEAHLSKDFYGQRLVYAKSYITCTNSSFELHDISNDNIIKVLNIPQSPDKIDTEDRIILLKKFIADNSLI